MMHLRMLVLLIVVGLVAYTTYILVPPDVRSTAWKKAKPHLVPVAVIVATAVTVAVLAYSFGAIHLS